MEHQNAVKEYVNASYHDPDATVREDADRWLQKFQRTSSAWKVADKLLHDSSSDFETLLFCSQTLRIQVEQNFEQLSHDAIQSRRDSLTTLFKKFLGGPPKLRTQISISLAALASHVSQANWGDGGIISWLRREMDVLPEYEPGFLELLTVLPKEAFIYSIAAHADQLCPFKNELTSQMETVLTILQGCLIRKELKEHVLEAFASWLRLLHGGISVDVLACHPLVHEALSSLKTNPLSEASVNVVSELIHHAASPSSGGNSVQTSFSKLIVPQVLSMNKTHLDGSWKDNKDVKAIGRLLADLGDSHIELIATGSKEYMGIVEGLVDITSHLEYDIASMTFKFWHSLQLALKNRARYPKVYQGRSYEDINMEVMQTRRNAVANVLTDAASIVGGNKVLKLLHKKFRAFRVEKPRTDFRDFCSKEATLFCIWAISKYVTVDEAEVMPKVMVEVQSLPQLAQLLKTVCLLVGAYSKGLNASSTSLPSIIEILKSGMETSKDCAAAATLAFRHICDDCSNRLKSMPVPTINAMMENIELVYRKHPEPSYLYLSSEIIKIFGRDERLRSPKAALLKTLFKDLKSIEVGFASGLFSLASTCLRHFPYIFLADNILSTLVDCSMVRMHLSSPRYNQWLCSFDKSAKLYI